MVIRGEHGSDFSGSGASGSGFSGFGFEILIPNPSELILDASGSDFGLARVGLARVRAGKNGILGLAQFFQKCHFFCKNTKFFKEWNMHYSNL